MKKIANKIFSILTYNFNLKLDQTLNRDEIYFVSQFMARRAETMKSLALRIGIVYHTISVLTVPILSHPSVMKNLVLIHGGAAILNLVPLIRSPIRSFSRDYMFPILLILTPCVYLSLTYIFIRDGNADQTFLCSTISVVVSIFGLLISPANLKFYGPLAIGQSMAGILATMAHPLGAIWSLVFVLCNFFAVVLHASQQRQQMDFARREFSLLIQSTPAQIIRHSVDAHRSLSDLISPRERFCVCVCSDWRGYQLMTSKIPAEKLAMALGDYYNTCNTLLSRSFPDGNYYSDWIADELFIVIFGKNDMTERELINQALVMSYELIQEKDQFYRRYGFPESIDIGVSSGPAFIGMMGPEGQKKATALGNTPGKARRYQSTGNLIRKEMGAADRIVFGRSTLLYISEPFAVEEFKIEQRQLRDLDDVMLYYIEPVIEDTREKIGDVSIQNIAI